MLNDVVDDDISFRDSLRMRGRESLRNLKNEAVAQMTGSGIGRKRGRSQSKTKTGRVKKLKKSAPRKKSKKSAPKKKKKKTSSKIPSNAKYAYL